MAGVDTCNWRSRWSRDVGTSVLVLARCLWAFESAGWTAAPTVDKAVCLVFDLLNHVFFAVISGLVLEDR